MSSRYRLFSNDGAPDNQQVDSNERSLYDNAGRLSRYAHLYVLPLFRKTNTKEELTGADLGQVPKEDRTHKLGIDLNEAWQREISLRPNEASFIRAIWATYGCQFLLLSLWELFSRCLALPMQAVALGWLITALANYNNNKHHIKQSVGVIGNITSVVNIPSRYTTIWTSMAPIANEIIRNFQDPSFQSVLYHSMVFLVFICLAIVATHPYYFKGAHLGMKCRAATCHMIYEKSLKLSQSAMSQTTIGQIVNLLSNDTDRFDDAALTLCYLVIAPLQTIIVLALLACHYLHIYSALTAMVAILFYVGLQCRMSTLFGRFRRETAQRTDERVRLMNEIVSSIKVIKTYGWEQAFEKLVRLARLREMDYIGKTAWLKIINSTLFFGSRKIITFVALMIYMLMGYQLSPERVFVTLALADLPRVALTLLFPRSISNLAEVRISCSRIQEFLQLDEARDQPKNSGKPDFRSTFGRLSLSENEQVSESNNMVELHDVTAAWKQSPESDRKDVLRNVSLSLDKGDLLLIVGRVGSGKTSILMSILGELPISQGQLNVSGRLSYASQEAWIFSGTIRDNILFGETFYPEKYRQVLRVCSLDKDMLSFQNDDQTIVGERGVSLSGGQKARVNLARALYHEADIYLLDDPLSAVDAPVARHIFQECLRSFLKEKTVILTTHQLQFLHFATKVLLMDNSNLPAFGTLEEVMASKNFALVDYDFDAFENARAKISLQQKQQQQVDKFEEKQVSQDENLSILDSKITSHQSGNKEDSLVGKVSADCSTYGYYVRNAAGFLMVAWFIGISIVAQSCFTFTDFWLSFWSDSQQRKQQMETMNTEAEFRSINIVDSLNFKQFSTIYTGLVVLIFATSFLRIATFFVASLRSSVNLHSKLFESILRAPMIFFDFTPSGIILNRISRDTGLVDDLLPSTAVELIVLFFVILAGLITTIIISLWNILPSIWLIIFGLFLRYYSCKTIMRLKQTEVDARSPIYSHLSITLQGLTTIRAFRAQNDFRERFDLYQDNHSNAWLLYLSSSRWLAVAMDWLCITFITGLIFVLLLTMLITSDVKNNASLVGLLIGQSVFIMAPFQWALRQLTELDSQMTSVERIREYSELQSELDHFRNHGDYLENDMSDDSQFAELANGDIIFRDVSLNYSQEERPVLKNINLHIKRGEKIGIVGRTGAGKSSLMSVLFRLYPYEGSVLIGSHDTKLVQINKLRQSISIIPQDPILFSGSIRKNLDPCDRYADRDLWLALETVRLSNVFKQFNQGLEYKIDEGGKNFSIGQRQLICLARAIVRRNNILVMDEATANVDPETDIFIQKSIREQFSHCTVLTIAHRLGTVMDSDKIIVMDAGQIKELDEPHLLLCQPDSLLTRMAESTSEHAGQLRRLARESYESRHMIL